MDGLKTKTYTRKAIDAYQIRNKNNPEYIHKCKESKAKYHKKQMENEEYKQRLRERATAYYHKKKLNLLENEKV